MPPQPNAPKVSKPFPFRTALATKQARFTAFIYGFSGAGKTFLLRSALEREALYPILVLSCDQGHRTVQDLATDDGKLTIAPVGSLEEIEDIANWCVNNKVYRTVAIDGLTELYRKTLLSWAAKNSAGKSRSKWETTQQDYGYSRLQYLGMASSFVMEPTLAYMNVIFTAWAARELDEQTGMSSIVPDLSGKLGYEIPGYFDVCGLLEVVTPAAKDVRAAQAAGKDVPQTQRVLITSQSSRVPMARIRGANITQITSPTLSKIQDAIQQSGA